MDRTVRRRKAGTRGVGAGLHSSRSLAYNLSSRSQAGGSLMRLVTLVTGGAGFIASHIVDELLRRGERVRVLDNFSTGREENLAGALRDIELIRGDIRDPEAVRAAVAGAQVVIHHAALASVPLSIQDPSLCNDVNVNGTLNLLVAARDAGVRRFILASSSAVYGDRAKPPLVETMPPAPISPYGLSKLTAEDYC